MAIERNTVHPAPITNVDDVDDIGDPSSWEIEADSESDGPMGIEYVVSFTSEEARLIARAQTEQGLDVVAVARRAVLDAAQRGADAVAGEHGR